MPRVRTGESVLARAVRLIEAFGPGEQALAVGELARRAALPLPTTSRLVEELVRAGWLERHERRVRIGYRLWEVASRASPTSTPSAATNMCTPRSPTGSASAPRPVWG